MKSTLLASILFALPVAAQAAGGYVEGQIGNTSIGDVDLEPETTTELGLISGSLDYDAAIGYGLEIGIRDFEQHRGLRVGLAWNRFKAELDSLSLGGTGGTLLGASSGSASSSRLASLGYDFDNDVNVYSANFYYDFPVGIAFKPYMGFGVGVADIENARDKELALIVLIGGKYEISESTHLGIKYQHITINDFENERGFEFEDSHVNMISVTLGVNF